MGGFNLAPNTILENFIRGTQEREHLEQQKKENEMKERQIKAHEQQVEASVKHLNALITASKFGLHQQHREDIEAGRIPGAAPDIGVPQGSDSSAPTIAPQMQQIQGQPAPQAFQGPTNLGPRGQVKVGHLDPVTGDYLSPDEYRSPQEMLRTELAQARAKGGLAVELAGAKAGAESNAEMPNKLRLEKEKLEGEKSLAKERAENEKVLAKMHADTQERITKMREAGDNYRNSVDNATRLAIADKQFSLDPEEATVLLPRVANAEMSREDLIKTVGAKKFARLDKIVADAGIKIVSAKQFETITNMGNLGPVIEQLNDFIKVAGAPDQATAARLTGLKNRVFGKYGLSGKDLEMYERSNELKGLGMKIGRAIYGEKGQVPMKLVQQVNNEIPQLGLRDIDMVRRRDNILKIISRELDTATPGMSDAQRAQIAKSRGIPYIPGGLEKTGDKVKVKQLSTGKIGFLPKSEFDPKQYEMAQ